MANLILLTIAGICASNSTENSEMSFSNLETHVDGYDNMLRNITESNYSKTSSPSSPRNFITNNKCGALDQCISYLEFDRIVDFYTTIPNFKKLNALLAKGDIKHLERIAKESKDMSDYDANSSFFYYADSIINMEKNIFSYDFIVYFLDRFYYFLDSMAVERSTSAHEKKNTESKSKSPINLLDLESKFIGDYGTMENALRIFNIIITDTTITCVVNKFILLLKEQIHTSYMKHRITKSKNNSYFLYYDLLMRYLCRTNEIAHQNLQKKINFITPQVQKSFILFNYQTGVEKTLAALFIPIPDNQFMKIENTARFIQ